MNLGIKLKYIVFFILFIFLSIQLVSAACVDATGGLVITEDTYVCPGTYYIDSGTATGGGTPAIEIQVDNVIVDCNGARFIEDDPSARYWPSVYFSPVSGYSPKENVTIKNCYFEGFNYSIYAFDHGAKIINNVINITEQDAIQQGPIANRITIKDNTIIDAGEIAIFGDTWGYATVVNNTVIRSGHQGFNGYQIYNSTISENTFIDCDSEHNERRPLWSDSEQTQGRAGSSGVLSLGPVFRDNIVKYNNITNNKQAAIEYRHPNINNDISYNSMYGNGAFSYTQNFVCPKGGAENQSCFLGNGTKTQFWLYYPDVDNETLEVRVNGVLKTQGTDYTLNEDDIWEPKLDFTVAPPASSNISVIFNFTSFVQFDGIENKNLTYEMDLANNYWGEFDPLNYTNKLEYIDLINNTYIYDNPEYQASGYPDVDCPPFVMTGGGGYYSAAGHSSAGCDWPDALQTYNFCPILSAPYPDGRLVSCEYNNTQPKLNISEEFFLHGGAEINEDLYEYTSDWEDLNSTYDNINFTIISETNTGVSDCTINGDRYFNCTNVAQGQSNVTLKVNDSELEHEIMITITVNDPPYFNFIDNFTWNKKLNQTFNVSEWFTDPDGDALEFTITFTNNITIPETEMQWDKEGLFLSDTNITFIPVTDFIGTESVIITAYDPYENNQSNEFYLIVREPYIIYNITTDKNEYESGQTVTFTANLDNSNSESVILLIDDNGYFANCDYTTQTGCLWSSTVGTGDQLQKTTTASAGQVWFARVCNSDNYCIGQSEQIDLPNGNNYSTEYDEAIFNPEIDFNSSMGDAYIHGQDVGDRLGNYNMIIDINGDGFNDVLTTATSAEQNPIETSMGEVYVFYGDANGFYGDYNASNADITIYGYEKSILLTQFFAVSDMNGDGNNDLVLGGNSADWKEHNYYNNGRIYIIYDINNYAGGGPYNISSIVNATIWGVDPNPASASPLCTSPTSCRMNSTFYGRYGWFGDINGDDVDDLLMPGGFGTYHEGNFREGFVLVHYGNTSETLSGDYNNTDFADLMVVGKNYSYFGFSMDFNDFNNDGIEDWLVSAYKADPYAIDTKNNTDAGEVYIIFGPIDQTGVINATDIINTTFVGMEGLFGTQSGESIGYFKVNYGDLNADAFDDVVFGGRSGDPWSPMYNNSGRTYVFYNPEGNWPTEWNVTDANVTFISPAHNDLVGGSHDIADVNLDGYGDLLIYSDQVDNGQQNAAGQEFLFYFPWPNGEHTIMDTRNNTWYNRTICDTGITDPCDASTTSMWIYYWRIDESTLKVYYNGTLQTNGVDYTLDLSDPIHLNAYLSWTAPPDNASYIWAEFNHTWNYEKPHPSYATIANFTVRGTQSVGDLGMQGSFLRDMNNDGTPDLFMDERQFSHNGISQVGRDVIFYLYEGENGGDVYGGTWKLITPPPVSNTAPFIHTLDSNDSDDLTQSTHLLNFTVNVTDPDANLENVTLNGTLMIQGNDIWWTANTTDNYGCNTDGTCILEAIATDADGETNSTLYTITVDDTAPTFMIVDDTGDDNYKAGETITFDIDIAETGLTVTADLTVLDSDFSAAQALTDDADNTYSFTTAALDGGGNMQEGSAIAITFTATDDAGNVKNNNTFTLELDKTNPTIGITSGTDAGPVTTDTINLDASDTNLDAGSLEYGYSADNTCDVSDTYGNSFTDITDFDITGDHTDYLCSKALDNAGNIGYQLVGQLNVDNSVPTVSAGNIAITIDTDNLGAGVANPGDTIKIEWDDSATGDNNGDTASVSMDLTNLGGGAAVAAVDDGSACDTVAADDKWTVCYSVTAGAIDNAALTVDVSATDAAANTGGPTTSTDTVSVDNEAPTISVAGTMAVSTNNVGAAGNAAISDGITYTGGTEGTGDTVSWTVDLSTIGLGASIATASEQTVVADDDDNAAMTYTETVTDNAGNTATGTSGSLDIDNQVPTIGVAGTLAVSTNNVGAAGNAAITDGITYTGGTEGTGDTVSWTIDLSTIGLGASIATASEQTVVADNDDNAAMTYTETVTDDAGNTASGTSGSLDIDNEAPTITVAGTMAVSTNNVGGANAAIGDGITYTGGTDSSGDTVSWTVDLSSIALGASVASAAEQTVVADDDDNAAITFTETATDDAGNTDTGTTGSLDIDNEAPTIGVAGTLALTNDVGGDTIASIGDDITYAAGTPGAADGDSWTIDLSAYGTLSATQSPGAVTIDADDDDAAIAGTETITDNAGNTATGAATITGAFDIDNEAPTITVAGTFAVSTNNIGGANAAINDGITYTSGTEGTGDAGGVTWTVDLTSIGLGASIASAAEQTVVADNDDNAALTFTETVTDDAGNTDTGTTGSLDIDNTAPTIGVAGTLALTNDVGGDTIASIGDDITYAAGTPGVADGDSWTIDLSGYGLSATASPGAITIIAGDDDAAMAEMETLTDNAGNSVTGAVTTTGGFDIDNEAPVITVAGTFAVTTNNVGGANAAIGDGITYTGGTDSSGDTVSWTVDISTIGLGASVASAAEQTVVADNDENAALTFTETATDNAGNTDTGTTGSLDIDNVNPTIGITSGTDAGPVATDTINLDASDTNLNAGSLEYGYSADNTCDVSDTYGNAFTDTTDFDITTTHIDYLCSKAADDSGNIEYQLVGQLNVDDSVPTFIINDGTEAGPVQTDTINVDVSDTNLDLASLEYGYSADNTCDVSDTYGNSFTDNTNFDITGDYTNYLCVKASDDASNTGYQLVGQLNTDNTDPTIAITSGTDAGPVATDTINLDASDTNLDAASLEYGYSADNTCDGADTYGNSFTDTTDFDITGDYTNYLCSKASDDAGNIGYQLVGQLNTDNTVPTIAITSGTDAGPVATDTINLDASDTNLDAASLEYGYSADNTCDGADTYGNSFTDTTDFDITGDYTNYLCAKASDDASNTGYQLVGQLNTDNTVPTIAITSGTDVGPVQTDTINLDASDTNLDAASLEYGYSADNTCDGADTYGNSFTDTTDFDITGDYTNYLCAKALDDASNTGYQLVGQLNTDNTDPTITVISGTDVGPVSADTINLDAADTNLDTASLEYGYSADNTCDVTDTYGNAYVDITDFDIASTHTDYLCAQAGDDAGNLAYQLVGQLNVDNSGPTFTINDGTAAGPVQTDTINVDVNDIDLVAGSLEYGFSADGVCDVTDTYGNSFTDNTNFDLAGDYTNFLCVKASDLAANTNYQLVGQLNTDNTDPTLIISEGTNAGPVQTDTINLDASDTNLDTGNLEYGYSADNTCDVTDTYGNSFTDATNFDITGTYTNYLCSKIPDQAGNIIYELVGQLNTDNTIPVITLTGADPQTIEVGTAYSELGGTASDTTDGVITGSIVIDAASVDTNTVGSYSVTYDVTDSSGNDATQVTRTVDIVDTTLPVITLTGADPQTIEVGTAYSELGGTASDNYDGVITGSIVIDAASVDTNTVGSYSVTYDVTDSSGNDATQVTRTVDIVDTTLPVITLTGADPQTIEVGTAYSELGGTASDNYDGVITGSIVIDTASVDTNTVGSYTVTYDVTDANSNDATQVTRTVNVVDTTLPVITLTGADPQTIEVGTAYSELGGTASDNYDGVITGSIVINAASVDINTVGSYSVTYDVTDANSNDATQVTRTVNVVDTTLPVITLVGANPQSITVGDAYVELGATASDNYDGVITGSIVIDTASVDTNTVGSYTVTYDVTDANSNDAVQVTRTVDVVAANVPVITLTGSNPQTIEVGTAYSELGGTASDAEDGDLTGSIVIDASAVDTNTVGSYSVTYDVQDSDTNDATQVIRTVNIVDTTVPVITLTGADPQTIEVGTAYSELGGTASDNYDGVITGSIVIDTASVDTNTVGSYSVTYDVTDANSNDAVQVTRTVNVVDTTIPVITLTGADPQSITVGDAYVELGATASDNYDGVITGSIVINSAAVDINTIGSYSVTYDVTDANSNDAVQVTRTINVVAANVPVITLTGSNPQTIEVGTPYSELGGTASDAEDGDLTGSIVIDASAVDTNTVGSYSVTYDVQDSDTNDATQVIRTVNIVDTTVPVITLIGSNPQTIEVGTAYSELGGTASDNYDGVITGSIVIDATAVDTNTVGSYSVTYDVTDANSNDATQVIRTVNIVDTTVPVITLTGADPQSITVGNAYTELGATASDNYDGVITGSIVINSASVDINTLGSYTVTYDVTDANSNDAVQVTRTVNIVALNIPIITLTGSNPQTIELGSAYSELGGTATDVEDGDLTGSIVINSASVDTNTLGSYSVTYDVQDSDTNDATQAIRTVNVVDTTDPVWNPALTDQTIEFGLQSLNLALNADDQQTVTYSVDDTTNFMIDTNALKDKIALSIATYPVTVTATDASGNSADQIILVTVQDTTDPVWNPTPTDQSIIENESLSFTVNADDLQTITYLINDTTNFAINTGTITNASILNPDNYALEITARDASNNEVSITINIEVQAIDAGNQPPTIDSYTPLSDPTILHTQSQVFTITKSDPEDDPLTVQWYVDDELIQSNQDTLTYSVNYNDIGTHEIKVNVTDGEYSVEQTWEITVNRNSMNHNFDWELGALIKIESDPDTLWEYADIYNQDGYTQLIGEFFVYEELEMPVSQGDNIFVNEGMRVIFDTFDWPRGVNVLKHDVPEPLFPNMGGVSSSRYKSFPISYDKYREFTMDEDAYLSFNTGWCERLGDSGVCHFEGDTGEPYRIIVDLFKPVSGSSTIENDGQWHFINEYNENLPSQTIDDKYLIIYEDLHLPEVTIESNDDYTITLRTCDEDGSSSNNEIENCEPGSGKYLWAKYNFVETIRLDEFRNLEVSEAFKIFIDPHAVSSTDNEITYFVNDSNLQLIDGQFIWQTDYEDSGIYAIKITASDGINQDSKEFSINVIETNVAPFIEHFYLLIVEGETITLDPFVVDLDDDDYTITYEGWMTSPTKTTEVGDAGTYYVNITADDGEDEKYVTVKIYVNPDHNINNPPYIVKTSPEDQYITLDVGESERKSFSVKVEDLDDDKFYYYWYIDDQVYHTSDETMNYFQRTVRNISWQNKEVRVVISDGVDSVEHKWYINANDVNHAPVLNNINNIVVDEGELITINPSATDSDLDELTISYTNAMNSNQWQTNYEDSGTYSVRVTVSDGDLTDYQDVQITINNVRLDEDDEEENNVPELDNLNNINVDEGDLITINPSAEDDDNDDLTFSYSGAMLSNIWQTDLDDAGTYSVTVTVSDGEDEDSQTITITINNVNENVHPNSAPILSAISDKTVNEGQLITINPSATDPNSDSYEFTYSGAMTSNTWQTDDSDEGVYVVRVTVTDEHGASDYQDVTITINQIIPNRAPEIISYSPESEDLFITDSDSLDFTVAGYDPDGDILTYTWYVNNEEVSNFNNYEFTPSDEDEYVIKVIVSDGELEDTQRWYIDIISEQSGGPDLAVTEIVTPNNLEHAKRTPIHFIVENLGTETVENVKWSFDDGNGNVQENVLVINKIQPGHKRSININHYYPDPGTYTITFFVDHVDEIEESNEENNILTKTITLS
ncbi:immunoglobulin-like domain-containing protein [Nanoarchaeota archaeon]